MKKIFNNLREMIWLKLKAETHNYIAISLNWPKEQKSLKTVIRKTWIKIKLQRPYSKNTSSPR